VSVLAGRRAGRTCGGGRTFVCALDSHRASRRGDGGVWGLPARATVVPDQVLVLPGDGRDGTEQ